MQSGTGGNEVETQNLCVNEVLVMDMTMRDELKEKSIREEDTESVLYVNIKIIIMAGEIEGMAMIQGLKSSRFDREDMASVNCHMIFRGTKYFVE